MNANQLTEPKSLAAQIGETDVQQVRIRNVARQAAASVRASGSVGDSRDDGSADEAAIAASEADSLALTVEENGDDFAMGRKAWWAEVWGRPIIVGSASESREMPQGAAQGGIRADSSGSGGIDG